MVTRPRGRLLDLEYDVLDAVVALEGAGDDVYGFRIARLLADGERDLIGHGTLYKALARLTASGLLDASWESGDAPEVDGRPRRRLYALTAAGSRARAARPDAAPGAARTALA